MDKTDAHILVDAAIKMERGRCEEAYSSIQHFQLDKITSWLSQEKGIYYWILGKWEDYQKNLLQAITFYAQSMNELQTCTDKSPLIRTMVTYSKALSRSGEEEKSLYLLKEAYELAIYENISIYDRITLFFQLGVQHGRLGEVYSAIYFLNQSLTYSSELDLQYRAGQIYMSLGICHMQLHQFDESKTNLENALLAFQLTKDKENLAGSYMNLGILYGYQQTYDQAVAYLRQAIELYQQEGQIEIKLQCMIKLAAFLYQDGEWEEASSYCEGILREDSKDTDLSMKAYELLSDIAVERNQWDQGIQLVDKALALTAHSSTHTRLIAKKAKLLQQKGESKKALELFGQL
jgi:tetratricopeptide (TPR) repeat protein